jgi:hypothetical protein
VRFPLLTAATLAGLAVAAACNGGGSGGGIGRPPPPGAPAPSPGQNPCLVAALEQDVEHEPGVPFVTHSHHKRRSGDEPRVDERRPIWEAFWTHQAGAGRLLRLFQLAPQVSEDVGDIAVLRDAGDLIQPPNPFDLANVGLRFSRVGTGYQVARADAAFRPTLGTRLVLDDDDSAAINVPFAFPFYAGSHGRAFVNSDGNITFDEEDRASTERNVSRLLTGPPRVAPFFADLDPSVEGRVYADSAADAFTVTWCAVRGFDSAQTVTTQVSLFRDGAIEMRYDRVELLDAIVGLSPGRTGRFVATDLGAGTGTAAAGEALGERFAERIELDLVAVARRFYQSHDDRYDQLVIWTDAGVTRDAFAYEINVANEVRGLGLSIFDQSRAFGSAGRLRSLVMMDALGKYPADPTQPFLGENSTVALVAHETGHRWLAFMEIRDYAGRTSDALLGRDQSHWSFFKDSDGSVMEGNDIEDLGGGRFRTVGAVYRFSALDQYAMGLRAESEVPPFFYVEAPTNVRPSREAGSAPQVGVSFDGTRRDVLLQDIVAVNGPRQPSAAESSRVHRQAFIYVLSSGRALDGGAIERLERVRRSWESFYDEAVERRGRVETRLRPPG